MFQRILALSFFALCITRAWGQPSPEFVNVGFEAGLVAEGQHHAVAIGDYDNDGDEDIYVGSKFAPNLLYRNDGNLTFTEVGVEAGVADEGFTNAAIWFDFDNDGDLDIGVTHIGSPFALLENNTQDPHHFLGLELVTESRIHPVGTRVEVTYDGETRVYCTSAGGSYLSDPDRRVLVGLGNHTGSVDVKILWSTGDVTELPDLAAQRYWRVSPDGPPLDLSQLAE